MLTIIFCFFFVFCASRRWMFNPNETVLTIWREDVLFSFTLFLFREHRLNFDSRGSPRNALLSWTTFQWEVENIPFPHLSTYVSSYLSRKYWIILGVDLFQGSMDNIGCIYQDQEIMSFFVSAVIHLRSSNSGFL